jgi:hypothetical protein
VRWVLTGGTFQPNVVKFQDAESGKLLTVFHTPAQREASGAAKARIVIEAQGKVDGWPPAPQAWTRVPAEGE